MSAAFEDLPVRTKLISRADGLKVARQFFADRKIVEVDCLALVKKPSIDVHIDLFSVSSPLHGERFLFSSPEYAMKRLLSKGSGDIYYLGHVWRNEAHGRRHSPEFLLAEWYRIGFSFQEMIDETMDFVELFTGPKKRIILPYRTAFLQYAHIDPLTASHQEILSACLAIDSLHSYPLKKSSTDELLNLLLAFMVEPAFDQHAITALTHYPPSQAALANRITADNSLVAERFEIYYGTLELANGYHELTNSQEQRARFTQDNIERVRLGKEPYAIDEDFLAALQTGLPDCCGVAVGIDRLLMLKEHASSISAVMPLSWVDA
jgi:lysyl-tRNA synthetase class 2